MTILCDFRINYYLPYDANSFLMNVAYIFFIPSILVSPPNKYSYN